MMEGVMTMKFRFELDIDVDLLRVPTPESQAYLVARAMGEVIDKFIEQGKIGEGATVDIWNRQIGRYTYRRCG